MNLVIGNSQQDSSAVSQQPTQNQPEAPVTGFCSGPWSYRDIAMFSTQGISGIGALATFALGGWNTAPTTPSTNISNNQPTSLTTTNSYVLIACGLLLTAATLVQVGAHYHWRQDVQNAKNVTFKSLGDELEKNFQEFQDIVEKTESIRKQIGSLNQEPIKKTQSPLAEEAAQKNL